MLKTVFTINVNEPNKFVGIIKIEDPELLKEIAQYYDTSDYVKQGLETGSLFQEPLTETHNDIERLMTVDIQRVEFRINQIHVDLNDNQIIYECTNLKGTDSLVLRCMQQNDDGSMTAEFKSSVIKVQNVGVIHVVLISGLVPKNADGVEMTALPFSGVILENTAVEASAHGIVNPIVAYCFNEVGDPMEHIIESVFISEDEYSALDIAFEVLQATKMPAQFVIKHFERFNISALIASGNIDREVYDAKFGALIANLVASSSDEELYERSKEFNVLCNDIDISVDEFAYKVFGSLKALYNSIMINEELAVAASSLLENILWLNTACATSTKEFLETTDTNIAQYLFDAPLKLYMDKNPLAGSW